jgi:hypothetical protein
MFGNLEDDDWQTNDAEYCLWVRLPWSASWLTCLARDFAQTFHRRATPCISSHDCMPSGFGDHDGGHASSQGPSGGRLDTKIARF